MYLFFKRLIDVLIASIVFMLFLPFFIPIVILLKLTGEGQIFYVQKRKGYKNEYFNILKFASMLKDSPNIGTGNLTLRNDPRVTPMGKFLRPTKINEFPQVFNVLKGDLSIVGPRPFMDQSFEAYSKKIQDVIYNVKPGITGIGSIVFRDEEKFISESEMEPQEFYKKVISPYKGELELWYQDKISFYTDSMIIFLTGWVILFPKSKLLYKIFPDLPERPAALKED